MKKQQNRKNRKTITLAIAALVGVTIAITLFFFSREKPVEVTTATSFRKEVIHVVTATGRIGPEIEVAMSPDVSGEIIELPVRDGQHVEKGELLFRIQPDVYINQVEQSQAQLNLAKSQSLEAQSRKIKAQDDFRKASLLYKEKLISETDYLAAKTNADATRAFYEASRYSIEQNRSLLDQNQERMRKTVVKAPIEGAIIKLNSKIGERVVGTGQFPGTEVLRVANLDSMQVEVEVNENDIVNVHKGNPVSITVDAFGERIFRGIVHEISNSAVSQAAGTQEEVTNFSVKIRILDHKRLLKPGMSATADIEAQRVKNALVVPIQSVTVREAGGINPSASKETVQTGSQQRKTKSLQGVFVVRNGKAYFRKTSTGTTDNTHIVITSGLKAGEEVVSGSYSAISSQLYDGCPVTKPKP
ncbi:MAG: efflux RND transporter periplasmic adaptor subunit [Chlorobium sp.]|uniref:efflux RND transporter periplasmic adaptor subunit n=1 Tax=Chlorobium sp. TaxID=1095 RepID=UPI0025B83F9A|nr:efflux RND transporter periplasmic adaptor subunit [Chlorobium sp.]MCF8215704.1 efflux RND transporter periplasmic adaptor subunit [Chlorobium sp.]MCF8270562.1 efflux RND transporter periplasmic adaptor subunit [Chlorobium sp.]MCF8286913.1 efflux RND transporter periplasmic adaptor subunit [Chlorobium sp.]MCF8290509.1 efflux RND transporter periplasmic adaptor subunit [Chlorobium sp.]MCF8384595.1 efflux RND transporter periplasmic adaptor subunit [Chlorobium sp.]